MAGVKELYKKSYLFEIVDRNNPGIFIEAFTLTIPPENVEIEEPQRITRTKTFGGVFVDDMGPDIMPIRISGHTGGSMVRKTFKPTSTVGVTTSHRKLSGRESFFQFRDTIMRYKDDKSRKNTYHNYDIHLYDLSVVPQNIGLATKNLESIAEGYVVSLEKFKMTRNKDKPLFYNYSIEMIALRKLGSAAKIYKAPVSSSNPFSLLNTLRRGLRMIQSYFTSLRNIFDQVDAVLEIIDDLETKMTSFIYQTGDLIMYPVELSQRVLTLVKTLGLDIEDSFYNMVTLADKDADEFYDVLISSREVTYSANYLIVFSKTPQSVGSEARRLTTEISTTKVGIIKYEGMTALEAEIVSDVLDQETENIDAYIIYGYFTVIATGSTTMEKLALEYFGNPSQSYLIASFNSFLSDDDINPGDQVRIPILTRGASPEDNFVYSLTSKDVYGIDIKLDIDDKMVVAAAGDLSQIEGTNNLIQAMNLRLNEKLGARLRLTIYGINDSVGFAMSNSAPLSYAVSNLKDTLLQDPRISEINDIKIGSIGDQLLLNFNTKAIKIGDVIPFTGEV